MGGCGSWGPQFVLWVTSAGQGKGVELLSRPRPPSCPGGVTEPGQLLAAGQQRHCPRPPRSRFATGMLQHLSQWEHVHPCAVLAIGHCAAGCFPPNKKFAFPMQKAEYKRPWPALLCLLHAIAGGSGGLCAHPISGGAPASL